MRLPSLSSTMVCSCLSIPFFTTTLIVATSPLDLHNHVARSGLSIQARGVGASRPEESFIATMMARSPWIQVYQLKTKGRRQVPMVLLQNPRDQMWSLKLYPNDDDFRRAVYNSAKTGRFVELHPSRTLLIVAYREERISKNKKRNEKMVGHTWIGVLDQEQPRYTYTKDSVNSWSPEHFYYDIL